MNALQDVLLAIYGSREAVERWIRARGNIGDIAAEVRALKAWLEPRL